MSLPLTCNWTNLAFP